MAYIPSTSDFESRDLSPIPSVQRKNAKMPGPVLFAKCRATSSRKRSASPGHGKQGVTCIAVICVCSGIIKKRESIYQHRKESRVSLVTVSLC
ncbi:hypothetical protein VTN00DRAFT_2348 [Thermoascus crustaceus]|uniref:uncharacterized protein n=1 Tax=Thermoascus crustaceus TaxID=5088 RepID=UPI003742A52F